MQVRVLPLIFAIIGATVGAVYAFPPAPNYTLYGIVRDQVGQTIRAEGAVLILLKGANEIGRTTINSDVRLDQNYELSMRIDANLAGLAAYSEKAVTAQSVFSLAVEINGERFLPIEASGTLIAGKGGERVHLDLNLGQDTDNDGLADVWEEWQLWQSGNFPDGDGLWPLHLLDRNGDFDKDGQSNFLEYIAGTYAGDAAETFNLKIKEKMVGAVKFEFFAITGKTYVMESSTDMQTWKRENFNVGATPATGASSYQAADVSIVTAFAGPEANPVNFYRLSVR